MAEAESFDLMTRGQEPILLSMQLFLQGAWSTGTKGTAMLTTTCPKCMASCRILTDGSAAVVCASQCLWF